MTIGRIEKEVIHDKKARAGAPTSSSGAERGGTEEGGRPGGLYVIGTNRHESLRIDEQLRGRAGRQGDRGKEPLGEFQKSATEAVLGLKEKSDGAAARAIEELVRKERPIDFEAAEMKGPSSTWTYLVEDEQSGWGIELLKGRNIGFAAGAAGFWGLFFCLLSWQTGFGGRKKGAETRLPHLSG